MVVTLLWLMTGCMGFNTDSSAGEQAAPLSLPDWQISQPEYQRDMMLGRVSYPRDVKPILDSRCIVCHACYDAPCQLKLTSREGLQRGASKAVVYDGERLNPAPPTRLFVDAGTTAQWRHKGFYPVLNEGNQSPTTNLEDSTLALMLALKQEQPMPTSGKLPDAFEFGLSRDLQCPQRDEFDEYRRNHPLWGMPYGLPALESSQHQTLVNWLRQGAKVPPRPPLPVTLTRQIGDWETFLNVDNPKQKLVSRYLYEHLFIGHLHFHASSPRHFFKLVRSTTPPGRPIREIATLRPYDPPGSVPFYYRLRPILSTIVDKNHFVYELSPQKMTRLRELFLKPDYTVNRLPDYRRQNASNPFLTFAEIPPQSRYQFMLDDAAFFVSGFIKGPVCRGQIALNVIRDQFWVAFISPDLDYVNRQSDFLARNSRLLALPAAGGDNMGLLAWHRYDALAKHYMKAKQKAIDEVIPKDVGPNLDFLWDGEKTNPNAALTVFRHYDSATVVPGMIGKTPLTAWVLSYSTFERLHYLLVAGFNVFGNVGHQLATRKYMDYLRMEAENDFLRFLPSADRKPMRNLWYRGFFGRYTTLFDDPLYGVSRPTGIHYHSDDPKKEFFHLLRQRLGHAVAADPLNRCEEDECTRMSSSYTEQRVETLLRNLAQLQGKQLYALPEVSFLNIRVGKPAAQQLAYTLIRNKMLENVSSLVAENIRRLPDEDTLTIVPGLLGSYPNFFFSIEEHELQIFASMLADAHDSITAEKLYQRFGVHRTDNRIWELSDWFNRIHHQQNPIQAGWFDLNRYHNF